ncbi:uncharacterized protein TNCV_1344801 [Trichonephila clavipes]|nr:uncharacterized protein TNCV_1344801 [Trichonephila clavipes]
MSSGRSLSLINLGVQGGIQGDSHMLMVGTGVAVAVSPPRVKSTLLKRGCGSPVVKVSDHGRYVMSLSTVPLKTHRVGQRCTLNLSRAETTSRWCGVVVWRGWVLAQVSSTSFDHSSKLRVPSLKAFV